MSGAATTPAGLYYLVAGLVLAVAAYSALLVVVSLGRRRPGLDVEVSHLAMGLAMAGMLVGALAFGPAVAWELVFGASLLWFLGRAWASLRRFGIHLPHSAVHALMSLAMLLMFFTASGSATRGLRGSGLSLPLAFLLLASAVSTLAAANRGWPVYGSHRDTPEAAPPSALERPLLLDASHVVMALAMSLALLSAP